MNKWDPCQSENHHHSGHDSPKAHQLPLAGIRLDLLIEIERNQGRRRVEYRAHRSHQCRQQGRNHYSHETCGQQIDNQARIRDIAVQHFPIRPELEKIAEERHRNQSRQYQHEHRQNLQKSSENSRCLGVSFIFCGEHALHDHLIRAPIPDPENGRAKKNTRPREI